MNIGMMQDLKRKNQTSLKCRQACYGDNIYHRDKISGQWIQENSHHSYENGETNYINLKKDTGMDKSKPTDYALISNKFWYFW